MFKVANTENNVLNSFAKLMNSAISNLNITEEVYSVQKKRVIEGIHYTKNQIILNNDFKPLLNNYGRLGGFSIIAERILQGFYLCLIDKFSKKEVDEQFIGVKREIISKFIINTNNTPRISEHLKYLLYKDKLIQITEKEIKNILVNETFNGFITNINHKFIFKDVSKPFSSNFIEAKLKDIKPIYYTIDYKKYNEAVNINKDLSELAKTLSQNPPFIKNSYRYHEIKLGLSDIKKSLLATMNKYYESETRSKELTDDKLGKRVQSTLLHVSKDSDDNFSNRKYTFYDSLLIISYCFMSEIIPKNSYFQFLKNKFTHNGLSSKYIDIENVLLATDEDKNNINEDFQKFILMLKKLAKECLVIGRAEDKKVHEKINSESKKIQTQDLIYFPNNKNYEYIVHQLFKDYFIYYFKGFDQLKWYCKY